MTNSISVNEITSKISLIIESELCDLEEGKPVYNFSEDKFNYVNSDRLLKTFDLIKNNQNLEKEFFGALSTHFDTTYYNTRSNAFPLVIITLLRLKKSELLLEWLSSQHGNETIFGFLNGYWVLLRPFFNQKSSEELIKYCKKHKDILTSPAFDGGYEYSYPSARELYKKLIRDQIIVLDEQLKDNFAYIKQDIEELNAKLAKNDFNSKLISLNNHINELMASNPDEHDVAGAIGNFREAFREFIEQLAEKIKKNERETEIPNVIETYTGNCRNYIKIKLSLSNNDKEIYSNFDKLMNSFVGKTNETGGHAYYTNPKALKFVRNMGITVISFLTDCYEIYLLK